MNVRRGGLRSDRLPPPRDYGERENGLRERARRFEDAVDRWHNEHNDKYVPPNPRTDGGPVQEAGSRRMRTINAAIMHEFHLWLDRVAREKEKQEYDMYLYPLQDEPDSDAVMQAVLAKRAIEGGSLNALCPAMQRIERDLYIEPPPVCAHVDDARLAAAYHLLPGPDPMATGPIMHGAIVCIGGNIGLRIIA